MQFNNNPVLTGVTSGGGRVCALRNALSMSDPKCDKCGKGFYSCCEECGENLCSACWDSHPCTTKNGETLIEINVIAGRVLVKSWVEYFWIDQDQEIANGFEAIDWMFANSDQCKETLIELCTYPETIVSFNDIVVEGVAEYVEAKPESKNFQE